MVYLTRSDLHDAAQQGDLDTVQRYFRKEGPAAMEEEKEARQRALGIAAEEGHDAVVRFLLKQGIDPNGVGPEAHSLLPKAVASGRALIVQWFLNHGADVNACIVGQNEDEFFGDSGPLICAVKSGQYEIARLLLVAPK